MSATKVYTLGLSSVKVGDAESQAPATALGYTYQDSCQFQQEDPTVQEFFAEEVDDPVVSTARAGKSTIEFDIMNPDVDVLATLMGGTAQSSSGETWKAPDSVTAIEKSILVTPKQGFSILMPRARIDAKINGNYAKSGIVLVHVKATCLQPATAQMARITLTKV